MKQKPSEGVKPNMIHTILKDTKMIIKYSDLYKTYMDNTRKSSELTLPGIYTSRNMHFKENSGYTKIQTTSSQAEELISLSKESNPTKYIKY